MAFGRFSFCGKGRGEGCEDARAYGRQTMFLHVHLLSFHGRLLASFRNTFLRSKQLFSKNLKKPLASRGRYFERSRKPLKKDKKGENIMQVLLIAALGVLVGAVSGFDLGYTLGHDAGKRGAK